MSIGSEKSFVLVKQPLEREFKDCDGESEIKMNYLVKRKEDK